MAVVFLVDVGEVALVGEAGAGGDFLHAEASFVDESLCLAHLHRKDVFAGAHPELLAHCGLERRLRHARFRCEVGSRHRTVHVDFQKRKGSCKPGRFDGIDRRRFPFDDLHCGYAEGGAWFRLDGVFYG